MFDGPDDQHAQRRVAVMDKSEVLAISLYVPDRTAYRLNGSGWLERWLCSGGVAVSHLVPGWWESAYAARLGPWAGSTSAGTEEPKVSAAERCLL
jgi:hypothetical protein